MRFDPLEGGGLRIRNRVDGVLMGTEVPPSELARAILTQLKLMARLDIAERRRSQDGGVALSIAEKRCDLCVSVVPTVLGERVVLRILDREAQRFDLEGIGLRSDDPASVRRLAGRPNGVVICGLEKAALGITSIQEVCRVVPRGIDGWRRSGIVSYFLLDRRTLSDVITSAHVVLRGRPEAEEREA